MDYINRYRVNKAKAMIQSDADITISDVADKVGYGSSQTFIRIFKRYEGVTPGSLREAVSEPEINKGKNGESQSQTRVIDE